MRSHLMKTKNIRKTKKIDNSYSSYFKICIRKKNVHPVTVKFSNKFSQCLMVYKGIFIFFIFSITECWDIKQR